MMSRKNPNFIRHISGFFRIHKNLDSLPKVIYEKALEKSIASNVNSNMDESEVTQKTNDVAYEKKKGNLTFLSRNASLLGFHTTIFF